MSEESRLQDSKFRFLRDEEKALLWALLETKTCESLRNELSTALVEDMGDGEMGSIKFKAKDEDFRTLGKKCAEAEYIDADGVEVSIVVNLDSEGNLYEIDFWKVDFSPLLRYPRFEQLRLVDSEK